MQGIRSSVPGTVSYTHLNKALPKGRALLFVMLTARGDALDLHQRTLGQGGDLHAAAGGILVEILGIDLVHGAKVAQVPVSYTQLDVYKRQVLWAVRAVYRS